MPALETTLRNQLSRVIETSHQVAETGVRAALDKLGVGRKDPYEYLSLDQRQLRLRLRAHARQLGDPRNPSTGEVASRANIQRFMVGFTNGFQEGEPYRAEIENQKGK